MTTPNSAPRIPKEKLVTKPIALRLTEQDQERTRVAARFLGHKPTAFARHIYLKGLADFEKLHGLNQQPAA